MYSDKDTLEINRRINRVRMVLYPALIALAALSVLGYARRIKWLALGGLTLLAAAAVFGGVFFLWPCMRYRNFLRDMQEGLSREMVGSVVSVAEKAEPQDGALVLPVHLLLTEEQDERIVYLNASKRDRLPPPGAEVRLKLYGRHIREVLPVEKG